METDLSNLNDLTIGQDLEHDPEDSVRRFYGKYRGTVVGNVDPEKRGRLLVRVPDVLGLFVSTWAMPCVPLAGVGMGMYVIPPPLGAKVWVEFEHGNPDDPIVAGGWWGSFAEVPPMGLAVTPGIPAMIMQTVTKNTIMLMDPGTPLPQGGIALISGASSILITPNSIIINSPSINVAGVTTINRDALVVGM